MKFEIRPFIGSILYLTLSIVIIIIPNINCHKGQRIKAVYSYTTPDYAMVGLYPTADTIVFPLDEYTYNDIRSFNYFISHGIEYLSFYDRLSQSINIYDFNTTKISFRINLKKIDTDIKLKNTGAFVKNLDSIFVFNDRNIYVIGYNGQIKKRISLKKDLKDVRFSFDSKSSFIYKNDTLLIKMKSYIDYLSLNEISQCRLLLILNTKQEEGTMTYQFPDSYTKYLYGSYFFDYNYCYCPGDRFVFSFPADSNIYVTDFKSYNKSYNGKSKYETSTLSSIGSSTLSTVEDEFKHYLLRDSYGQIIYDKSKARYLRIAKQKITLADYKKKEWKKEESIIIFDKNFRIIGESKITSDLSTNYIFFSKENNLYVRTKEENESNISFVRLCYND